MTEWKCRAPELSQLAGATARETAGSFVRGLSVNSAVLVLLAAVSYHAPQPEAAAQVFDSVTIVPMPARRLVPSKPRIQRPVFHPQTPPRALLMPAPLLPPAPPIEAEVTSPAVPETAPAVPAAPRPQAVVGTFQTAAAASSPARPDTAPTTVAVASFGAASASPAVRLPAGAATRIGGFADGAAASAERRTASARASTEAGFSAPSSPAAARQRSAAVKMAGFDDQAAAPVARSAPAAASPPASAAVQILNKPKPQYTDEARRLMIEGEVWLEILFGAHGAVTVQRVVRTLGHGLDESAVRAAAQIRFRPAEQDGKPIDQSAIVRVQFQLAN